MHQKILLFLLIALFLFGSVGCQKKGSFAHENHESQASTIHSETAQESTVSNESTPDTRKVLALEDLRNHPVSRNFEEDNLLDIASIHLPHTTLDERNDSFYNNEEELNVLVAYIHEALHLEIDNRWKVLVHYYDTDKTVGMVQFTYTIGEINTNRSILFNINGNTYDTVYSKCLTGDIDEAGLTARVDLFKSNYMQEKRELQEGETFYEDRSAFTYYIHSDILLYSYAYFFQYDMGIINNDWGTERIIDENGNAVAIS